MSLPGYRDYKGSGVEWIGEVPVSWDVCALAYRYDVALGKMLDEKQITGNHLAPYLRNVDVQWERINTDDLPQMDFAGNDIVRYGLRAGDLLVCEGGEVGRAAIWEGQLAECYYQKALHRLRPRGAVDSAHFFQYVLRGAVANGALGGDGGKTTIAHLPAEMFRRIMFAFPPYGEQASIAAFLDRETPKIDALIAEQERLLALLAEKRQATISHAVTRGLDPDVPMKDFGIAWLGEVPVHWEIVMLRRVVDNFEQGWSPECEARLPEEGEWAVLKAGCVNGGEFAPGECKALPSSLEPIPELEIKAGDVLMSRASGSPKLIGSVAVLDEPPARLMLSDKIFRLRLVPGVVAKYFALSMKSVPLRQQIEQAIGGADGLANNLSQASIKSFWIALPPEHEQREIVRQIDAKEQAHQRLSKAAERAIALLRERRSALIVAAVTGKIDVRDLAA